MEQHRVLRMASALVVICWWVATFGLTVVLTEQEDFYECFFSARGRVIEFVLGVVGCSLSTSAILRDSEPSRRTQALAITLFIVWLAFVVFWLPLMPHECAGE